MKTQQEQIEFANELQALTDKYNELTYSLTTVETAEDKLSVLKEIRSNLDKMAKLYESYTGDEK